MGRLEIRRVDGSRIIDQRRRQASERELEVLLGVAPVCPRQSLHYFEAGGHFPRDRFGVGPEGQLGIERDPQNFGILVQGHKNPINEDLGVVAELVGVGRKQRDRRLFRSHRESFPAGPGGDVAHDNVEAGLNVRQIHARFYNSKVVRVTGGKFCALREVADEEVEKHGGYHAALGNAKEDPTERRADGLVFRKSQPATEIGPKPPDEVGVKIGAGNLAKEKRVVDTVKRLGDVDGDCD